VSGHPKVFIVVLNWNGHAKTVRCIRSLEKITYPNHEILLVDNGSTDDSIDVLSAELPRVPLIQCATNLGYAGGNNVGIEHALDRQADYVLLLNNDTVVDPSFVEPLVSYAESHRAAGICGGKIYILDTPNVLDSAGGRVDLWFGRAHGYGHGEEDRGRFDSIRQVDYLGGACLLVSRRVFERIGLLPTHYFMYYEETDFALRAQRAGFEVTCIPESRVWHDTGLPCGPPDGMRLYYASRSQVMFIRRHASAVQKLVYFSYKLCVFFPRYAIQLSFRHPRLAITLARALKDGLTRSLPEE
jgi:GT2 family glycosyltransferase